MLQTNVSGVCVSLKVKAAEVAVIRDSAAW